MERKRFETDPQPERQSRARCILGLYSNGRGVAEPPPHNASYLFSWQTEEIKRSITPDEATCDKQIVGILQPLKHLTHGTALTFQIKCDKHSLTGWGGLLELNLIGRQREEVADKKMGCQKEEKFPRAS